MNEKKKSLREEKTVQGSIFAMFHWPRLDTLMQGRGKDDRRTKGVIMSARWSARFDRVEKREEKEEEKGLEVRRPLNCRAIVKHPWNRIILRRWATPPRRGRRDRRDATVSRQVSLLSLLPLLFATSHHSLIFSSHLSLSSTFRRSIASANLKRLNECSGSIVTEI